MFFILTTTSIERPTIWCYYLKYVYIYFIFLDFLYKVTDNDYEVYSFTI